MSVAIIAYRDPRFTKQLCKSIFVVLGTLLNTSTGDITQTDGLTDEVNRDFGNILHISCADAP